MRPDLFGDALDLHVNDLPDGLGPFVADAETRAPGDNHQTLPLRQGITQGRRDCSPVLGDKTDIDVVHALGGEPVHASGARPVGLLAGDHAIRGDEDCDPDLGEVEVMWLRHDDLHSTGEAPHGLGHSLVDGSAALAGTGPGPWTRLGRSARGSPGIGATQGMKPFVRCRIGEEHPGGGASGFIGH